MVPSTLKNLRIHQVYALGFINPNAKQDKREKQALTLGRKESIQDPEGAVLPA
jgi:hypothetical protein